MKKRNTIVLSSISLAIYQINLSLCGLSLNGDFEFLRHYIGIYISNDLNKIYCFLDENILIKNVQF